MHLKLHPFFTLIVFCLLKATVSETSTSNVYYWESFNGTIPEDAVIGGTNFGYNTYIGRGPVKSSAADGLFIGAIVPGSSSISLDTGNGIYIITQHLEILLSNKACDMKWVSTTSTSVSSLPGLMKAGYYFDNSGSFYVGRILLREQEYAIGHINQRDNFVLVYLNGTVHFTSSSFEILTYSPYH